MTSVSDEVRESMSPSRGIDRRREQRFPYQTVVTLVKAVVGGEPALLKCWTRDLSPSGARIMSLTPIEGDTVLLKLLLPRLGSKFIEAAVCSRREEQQHDFRNRASTMYLYGVQFTKVVPEVELDGTAPARDRRKS